ncbi:hypothetical protein C8R47DRAFT_1231436, partial [Mycena vitilis]
MDGTLDTWFPKIRFEARSGRSSTGPTFAVVPGPPIRADKPYKLPRQTHAQNKLVKDYEDTDAAKPGEYVAGDAAQVAADRAVPVPDDNDEGAQVAADRAVPVPDDNDEGESEVDPLTSRSSSPASDTSSLRFFAPDNYMRSPEEMPSSDFDTSSESDVECVLRSSSPDFEMGALGDDSRSSTPDSRSSSPAMRFSSLDVEMPDSRSSTPESRSSSPLCAFPARTSRRAPPQFRPPRGGSCSHGKSRQSFHSHPKHQSHLEKTVACRSRTAGATGSCLLLSKLPRELPRINRLIKDSCPTASARRYSSLPSHALCPSRRPDRHGVFIADDLTRAGNTVHPWIDRARPLVDGQDIVIGVVVGAPKDQEAWWAQVNKRASSDLTRIYHRGNFTDLGEAETRLTYGIGFGEVDITKGERNVPGPHGIPNYVENIAEVAGLENGDVWKDMNHWHNQLYKQYAPIGHAHAGAITQQLIDREIAFPAYKNSVFTTSEVSYGDAPCPVHQNPNAAFNTMEAVTLIGSWDHEKGGGIL